jgi:hypothetical protein
VKSVTYLLADHHGRAEIGENLAGGPLRVDSVLDDADAVDSVAPSTMNLLSA